MVLDIVTAWHNVLLYLQEIVERRSLKTTHLKRYTSDWTFTLYYMVSEIRERHTSHSTFSSVISTLKEWDHIHTGTSVKLTHCLVLNLIQIFPKSALPFEWIAELPEIFCAMDLSINMLKLYIYILLNAISYVFHKVLFWGPSFTFISINIYIFLTATSKKQVLQGLVLTNVY